MESCKLIGIVLSALLLSIVPFASCQPHPGEADGVEYGIAPAATNPLNIIVAYDEEIAGSTYDWFDSDVPGRTFVRWETIRALYRYPSMFHFRIIAYIEWDSEDGRTLEESLFELEEDFGWNRGLWWYGKWVSLLIGWTGEDNDGFGGKAHMGHCCCISKHQTDWTDDNTVQDEVNHLFGVDSHCESGSCVMSLKQQFYGYISEDLRPIEERIVDWIPVFNTQSVGAVSHNLCAAHRAKLLESNGLPDRTGDGIMSTLEINPENPPPEDRKEINPTNPWVPWAILGMVLVIVALVAVYIYYKTRRRGDK